MNLSVFNNNLFEAGTEFFNQLGIQLNSKTAFSLGAKELLKDHYKDKGIFKAIDEAYFLGLVDDSVFDGNTPLLNKEKISLKEAENRLTAEYNGLMVFAVRLKDSYSPTRGEIAELTRAFNRVSKSVPVVLLLKYGGLLSFATSERTKYKQSWREGEKIGKISLLKDIKVAAPHTGHLKILDDLKVAPAVTDFNALYKQWQEVFNVQLLNKKFYQELFYWYLWAVKKVKFPQIRPKEDLIPDEAHQSESVIRLLTRLLFCWFMKEKQELIPEVLFDKKEVKNILINFSTENEKSSVFYRAILQNLFFATLSVPIKNRKYIRESFQGKNRDYGNQYVYRYQNEFADTKENLKLFKDIPFLNGGLFECLDEAPENDNEKEIRLDGFSSKEKKQAFVPDYIFWDEHRGIDLSEELDNPRKTSETVHGIIDILNSYKFTIEENTPLEEEIALDPELLGKVFESLLAYYTPETKANARKQTGSFYTPREIVNYMVDESLFATFQQKLSDAEITENIEQRLRDLISYNETENQFTEKETNVIIQALENLKVLDPACGSGAFPMGILHKLVLILRKVDPKNKIWFESIIKRLPEYAQPEMRKKLEGENWDYLRKLGIIQQSIYGVDIQPIAIQIAKLRFFISLLVDQDIKGNGENNFGLQPLPNLDFKLVSANTLIGAPEQNQQNDGKLLFAQDEFFDVFNKLTGQYFGTYEPAEKKKLTKKIEKLVSGKVQEKLNEIQHLGTHTDERFSKHIAEKNKALIEQKKYDAKLWQSYNNLFKHESVGFFDIRYIFPEVKGGFDVVIGNPPYKILTKNNTKIEELQIYLRQFYSIRSSYSKNVFTLFIELGIRTTETNGILSFIVPEGLFQTRSYQACVDELNKAGSVKTIVTFSNFVFENTITGNLIFLFLKNQKNLITEKLHFNSDYELSTIVDSENNVLEKLIFKKTHELKNICSLFKGMVVQDRENMISSSKGRDIFLLGKSITKWAITDKYFTDYRKLRIIGGTKKKSKYDHYPRILIRRTGNTLCCALLEEAALTESTLYSCWSINEGISNKYLLALLNSRLFDYYIKKLLITNKQAFPQILMTDLGNLPILIVDAKSQQPFITFVDQILSAKKKDPNTDTFALEKQIDEMVYSLYGLTPEEIAIIERRK
jgi:adenine-specific DNA-methyltransferase